MKLEITENPIPLYCTLLQAYIKNLFINYNTITNYILIIYELSNFDHVLGVVLQTRVSRTHAHSLEHYSLDYQGTQIKKNLSLQPFSQD